MPSVALSPALAASQVNLPIFLRPLTRSASGAWNCVVAAPLGLTAGRAFFVTLRLAPSSPPQALASLSRTSAFQKPLDK